VPINGSRKLSEFIQHGKILVFSHRKIKLVTGMERFKKKLHIDLGRQFLKVKTCQEKGNGLKNTQARFNISP
jgi:hypothetical protein